MVAGDVTSPIIATRPQQVLNLSSPKREVSEEGMLSSKTVLPLPCQPPERVFDGGPEIVPAVTLMTEHRNIRSRDISRVDDALVVL